MTMLILIFSCLPQIIALSLIFFPSLHIFHDAKECFLKVKNPLQRNISLDLPQRIPLAGKKKKASEKLKIQQLKSIFLLIFQIKLFNKSK